MLKLKPSIDDLTKSAIRSILKNKIRTLLTSLGIIIGVTSVILLVSIGNGLKSFVADQFEQLGSNLLFVMPGTIAENGPRGSSSLVKFNEKDVNNLKKIKNAIVLPMVETRGKVKYLKKEEKTTILFATFDFGKNMNSIPSSGNGRWFTQSEENQKAKVAIIGPELKTKLFGNSSFLNKKINYSGTTFKIIGMLDSKGRGIGGQGSDNALYIPLSVGFIIANNHDIQSIVIKAKDKEDLEIIKKEAKTIMSKNYKKEDSFTVADQSQILSSINTILNTLTIALSGIAAISLLVGGIGIMNIMLVTVNERTREIGLRKAIGAYPRAILLQFLIEAIILSCLGGGIGIILGSLGAWGIDKIFPAKVTLNSVLLAFGVSTAVGIIFGVAPARKASKLSPIDALRYE
jgi:putative ABC transport system permease protein